MNIGLLLAIYWIVIFGAALAELLRVSEVKTHFCLTVAALRSMTALLVISTTSSNINPGGDGLQYQAAAQALAFSSATSLEEIQRLWGDYRYLPYIAINSFLE